MRKLARELVIFMLLSAVASFVGTAGYLLYERHKANHPDTLPANFFDPNKPYSSGPAEPTVWIMVDPYQEFGGMLAEPVKVPKTIADMLAAGTKCNAGEVTYGGQDEWMCVVQEPQPKGLRAGEIAGPPLQWIPAPPAGYVVDPCAVVSQTPADATTNGEIFSGSSIVSGCGFFGGILLWAFYRLVRFAVQG